MAWVAVPDLAVHRSEQRYEPIDGHAVRYVGSGQFTADTRARRRRVRDLYPGFAERV